MGYLGTTCRCFEESDPRKMTLLLTKGCGLGMLRSCVASRPPPPRRATHWGRPRLIRESIVPHGHGASMPEDVLHIGKATTCVYCTVPYVCTYLTFCWRQLGKGRRARVYHTWLSDNIILCLFPIFFSCPPELYYYYIPPSLSRIPLDARPFRDKTRLPSPPQSTLPHLHILFTTVYCPLVFNYTHPLFTLLTSIQVLKEASVCKTDQT